jgi:hypothetical protein
VDVIIKVKNSTNSVVKGINARITNWLLNLEKDLYRHYWLECQCLKQKI